MKPVFRIGLKYCGGCNPAYDRVALVKALATRLAGQVQLVPYSDPSVRNIRDILIVAGCQSACVDLAPFAGRRVRLISDAADLEPLISELIDTAKGSHQ